ncbi:unnamed protein product [Clonostachys rosea f. rosea IK726]|uniref:Transcriptional regulatory protein DEP1 n=3 Tax=Bionectria ochroleuca TaxID=29856 RepID=A0A0B7JPN1_BIOOC|nr:unnamed protein product [Clonostachys rosea f. rosea IK726]
MAATAALLPTLARSSNGAADPEDSNISSPLSDVDDKDTNDEDIDIHIGHHQDDDISNQSIDDPQDPNRAASDSDSALSDARSVAHSDANDTEAETERLYDTPRHQRLRDVTVDNFNDDQMLERTPSKLRRAALIDEDDDQADNESLPGNAAMSISGHSDDIESPSKPAPLENADADTEAHQASKERKRKRSPAADTPDSEQPTRKRTGSVGAVPHEENQDLGALGDEGTPLNNVSSGAHHEEPNQERETRGKKKSKRNGVKPKAPIVDDSDTVATIEGHDGTEDEPAHHDEVNEAEADEETDIAAKNAEELERKQAAFKDWTRIEDMFGVFRDRLYKDRLQRLEEEEQSLLADEPTHPEYLNMKRCLDDRLNRKLEEINKEHELRMRAHERRSVAIRSQAWSQFFQSIRETRERVLESLNRDWYDVQTTRRSAHSLPECSIVFPKDPAQRVKNAVAYNKEVATLAGIAKYEGFPAGPEIKGASESELAHDLAAMDGQRGRQKQPFQPPREEYQASSTFNRLGPAGEQFLKDTPWANPNHSSHKTLLPPTSTQMDGRAEQALLAGRAQPLPSAQMPPVEVETPLSTQRIPALSVSPEVTRASLKPGGPSKKASNMPSLARTSKTAAA